MRSSRATTPEQTEATAGRWPWWYGIAALAIGSLAAVAIFRVEDEVGRIPEGIGLLSIQVCFIVAAILIARQCGPVSRRTFGWRRMAITPGRALLWIVGGLICVGIANTIYASLLPDLRLPRAFRGEPDDTQMVLIALAAVVAAPIGEELLFRGLLYRSLRNRMGIALAVGLSAVVFGVMHWWFGDPAVLIFPRVALGVLLALLYEGTGSLYPSMLLHAWVNMGLATALFPELRGALGLALLAGAVVAVCVSVRDPRRKKHQRPPAAPEPPRFARTPLDAPESMRRVAAGQ